MRTPQAQEVVPVEPEKKDEPKETKPVHDVPQDESKKSQDGKRLFGHCSEMPWVHPSNFL